MIHTQTPDVAEYLKTPGAKGYIGFDPTADSLGVGNLVQVMTLVHFQRAGYTPVALVGGATGMVGDPSFKNAERSLLAEDQIQANLAAQQKQLEKFLDFSGSNAARIVNNYDWFKNFSFLGFIRDVGKHITVNYMMAKDSVQSRLESGLSFTEFSYQLIQGYDFFHLWKHEGIGLQMGGSDQWGNITTGVELIRRMEGGTAHALTTPLIKKADGTKFGKTEGGNVWLDPARTSPYKFYQFWLNAADADASTFIRIFSLKSRAEIEALEAEHTAAPHLRILQKALAEEITARVHSEADLQKALQASDILFGKSSTEDIRALDEATLLEVFEGVPQFEVPIAGLGDGDILDLLAVHSQVFPSKGEARKMIQQGGVAINKEKTTLGTMVRREDLLNGRYLLVQRGKKNYFLLRFSEPVL